MSWFRTWLQEPRLWLAFGALCFVGSFVLGYDQAQRVADQALALKSAPPTAVLIQNFDATRHTNPTREVRIFAEVDAEAPVPVTFTAEDGSARHAIIHPLFAVSAFGRDRLRHATVTPDAPLRPIPRPKVRRAQPAALGMAVYVGRTPDEAARLADADFHAGLGGGRYGRVVEIKGARVSPGNLAFVAQGAVAARGGVVADTLLTVRPFARSRMEAMAPTPLSPWHSVLQAGALFGGLLAIFFSARPYLPKMVRRRTSRPLQIEPNDPGHKTFSPIATQDEIAIAEEEDAARSHVPHPVLRIIESVLDDTKSVVSARVNRLQKSALTPGSRSVRINSRSS